MLLIVGLGNPGKQYKTTRHNIGFLALDALHKHYRNVWNLDEWSDHKKTSAMISEGRVNGQKIILAKPQTFMNRSGDSVQQIMKWHDGDPKHLLVIHDDVDFSDVDIHIQFDRNAGGHNGVRSIIEKIGTKAFWRLRVGIGKDPKIPTDKYVLAHMSFFEKIALKSKLKQLPQMIEDQFLKQ